MNINQGEKKEKTLQHGILPRFSSVQLDLTFMQSVDNTGMVLY